ncbi:MAG: DUF3025 domain-containing protein [Burkholderiaceae bacterium]
MLPAIDWQQPWFAPYRELGRAVASDVAAGASVAHALNAPRSVAAPRFVEPQAQGSEAYETFVARTSCVPTRDNAHDFFNGLVWLRFTALKRRLNLLHANQIEQHGVAAVRGAVRDRLTLFDENGALWVGPDALVRALRLHDWPALFVDQRVAWRDAQLTVVGHALLEKLVQPRKALTAHVWLGDAERTSDSPDPASAPFAPLPVLGVPGWWPGNEDPSFYADTAVFRPAGSPRSTDSARPCRS